MPICFHTLYPPFSMVDTMPKDATPCDNPGARTIDRRSFMKATLLPAALPIASAMASYSAQAEEPEPDPAPAGPDIIDTNVHLFEWPFRKLKYAQTEALLAKLRQHRITEAWAGSFEA